MLRTNSKKARENIRGYILSKYTPEAYDLPEAESFPEAARAILNVFREEKFYSDYYCSLHGLTEQDSFVSWCQGLPSILDTGYYYSRPAADDLAALLEETEAEKARFDDPAAELLLSRLIYRELIKEAK